MSLADELAGAAKVGQTFTPGLWKGDTRDWLQRMGENRAHAIITDPPYGLSAEPNPAEVLRSWLADGDFEHTAGGFMGQKWDSFVPGPATWSALYRVLRPGGHCLVFAGTRTADWMTLALRLAGFEIRDVIMWTYGSGFPKSLDVSKAVDKLDAADERMARARAFQAWLSQHLTAKQVDEITGTFMGYHLTTHPTQPTVATADIFDKLRPHLPEVPADIEELVRIRAVESANFEQREVIGTRETGPTAGMKKLGSTGYLGTVTYSKPATDEAKQWDGWGTALKPAYEPVIVARKPLRGTVAANVVEWGTGGLNIDACRVATDDALGGGAEKAQHKMTHDGWNRPWMDDAEAVANHAERVRANVQKAESLGRWPANLVLSCACDDDAAHDADCPVRQLDEQSGVTKSKSGGVKRASAAEMNGNRGPAYGAESRPEGTPRGGHDDSGGASRFFYCAKAPTSQRPGYTFERALFTPGELAAWEAAGGLIPADGSTVAHPTVKPLDLMRWLCRLVTPPGGLIVDPFLGSGSTAEAAAAEGFRWAGAERHLPYWPLIEQRVARASSLSVSTSKGAK